MNANYNMSLAKAYLDPSSPTPACFPAAQIQSQGTGNSN